MATVRWLGGTSGVVSTAANWVGGSEPIDNDDVVWDTSTTYPMLSGTFTNDIATLKVTEAATGSAANGGAVYGSASSPISFKAGGLVDSMEIAVKGNVYITGGTATVTLATFSNAGRNVVITGGTWTAINFDSVEFDIGASAVVTAIHNLGSRGTAAINGTAVTTYDGWGTYTPTSRNITNCEVESGSRVILLGTAAIATSAKVYSGGRLVHRSSGSIAGGDVRRGGLITPDGNPNTTATISATVWSGGQVILNAPGFSYAATITYRGRIMEPSPTQN